MFETKNHTGEIKDIDLDKRIVTGYLSAFGNIDHDNDIIEKGAFSKSILERKDKIRFLNQHNWHQPHGFFNILKEDDFGLYFESNPLPNTSYSNDALVLYNEGIMKEHSIGFQTIQKESKDGVRIIKEVKLYEGSNVTLGANSNTPFLGMKSLTMKDINDEVSKIMKALRIGGLTDETYIDLEIALKQLQTKSFELGSNTLNEQEEPSIDTPIDLEPFNNIKEAFAQFK